MRFNLCLLLAGSCLSAPIPSPETMTKSQAVSLGGAIGIAGTLAAVTVAAVYHPAIRTAAANLLSHAQSTGQSLGTKMGFMSPKVSESLSQSAVVAREGSVALNPVSEGLSLIKPE